MEKALIDRDAAIKWLFGEAHTKVRGGNNWVRVEEVVSKLTSMPAYLILMPEGRKREEDSE